MTTAFVHGHVSGRDVFNNLPLVKMAGIVSCFVPQAQLLSDWLVQHGHSFNLQDSSACHPGADSKPASGTDGYAFAKG